MRSVEGLGRAAARSFGWQVVQANDSERAAPRRLYFLGIELDDARNHAMAVMFVHRYLAAG